MNTVPVDLIDPNPYQPRITMDADRLAELAANIKQYGLLQPPVVRAVGKRYQLAFGHRRFAAWKLCNPDTAFPCDVRILTDREMFEYAITENEHRDAINPVERAQSIKRYIEEFEVSQAEAGKLFGLNSQGAVSNLMRLLKLPAKILDLLAAGDLSERDARLLINLCRIPGGDKAAINIAQHAAKQEPGDRSEAIDENVRSFLFKQATRIGSQWDLKWPKTPITIQVSEYAKGTPAEIPACSGCEFFMTLKGEAWCLRTPCYDAKAKLYRQADVEKAAAQLGIAMAAKGQKVEVVFWDSYSHEDFAKKVLKVKDKSMLRILAATDDRHGSYLARRVLGSDYAKLVTTDMAALKKQLPTEPNGRKVESKFDRERRIKRERAKECVKLVDQATGHFANLLPDNPALLELFINKFSPYQNKEREALQKKDPAAQRQFVMRELLLQAVPHGEWEAKATPANAIKTLDTLAHRFKVKLPKGWNVVAAPAPAAKAKPGKKK